MPSLEKTETALRPSAISGTFTTILGWIAASSRPSASISSSVVACTSALMGPSTMAAISAITSFRGRPVFATREGFVVTPSITPIAAASRISFRSAVSMKIFMRVFLPSPGPNESRRGRSIDDEREFEVGRGSIAPVADVDCIKSWLEEPSERGFAAFSDGSPQELCPDIAELEVDGASLSASDAKARLDEARFLELEAVDAYGVDACCLERRPAGLWGIDRVDLIGDRGAQRKFDGPAILEER